MVLWKNAPQICKATTNFIADATRGWHRTNHWLHHKGVRTAVFTVIVVAGRLQRKETVLQLKVMQAAESVAVDVPTAAAAATEQPPSLPIEIWLYAMRFFKRSWWPVDTSGGI